MNGTKRPCAYVTGADHGLGLSLVRALAKRNFNVVAGQFCPNEYGLGQAEIDFPELVTIVPLNVGDDESVQSAAAMIRDQVDTIDLVINNAAILGDTELTINDDLDIEQIKAVVNVNALGPLRVVKSVIELMKKGDTKLLVNISSEAGSIGNCYREAWFGYCMSKAALNMETAILQNSLRADGFRVFSVHPGYLRTYMMGTKNMEASLEPEEAAAKILGVLIDGEWPLDKGPFYIDSEGKTLPW